MCVKKNNKMNKLTIEFKEWKSPMWSSLPIFPKLTTAILNYVLTIPSLSL